MTLKIHNSYARRGLAPLELVLSLPILLFVMAMIVGIGAAASWKVRAQVVARQQAWSGRWPRSAAWNARQVEWPLPGTMNVGPGQGIASLDLDPLKAPVVRGPLDGGIRVNDKLLDPTSDVDEGHSHLERRPPLLPRLGTYKLDVKHSILSGRWQYRQMGLRSNTQRRIPFIYDLPEGQGEAAYRAAHRAILGSGSRPAWAVLDQDQELADFYGHYFDFHPRLSNFCGIDIDQVRRANVGPLIDRIQSRPPPRRVSGVPERMTQTFIGRYRDELRLLQLPDAIPNPARIAQLEALIEMLEAYLQVVRAS